MKRIPLTQGKFAIVDDEDYDWLNQWKWCATRAGRCWYAVRQGSGRSTTSMHREIMGLTKGDNLQTDHKDRNSLNNRRCNLRLCNNSENGCNRRPQKRAMSKYKGVIWNNQKYLRKKWIARIKLNYKSFFLGSFDNEIEAARAYDAKAKELFADFAYLNFPAKKIDTLF